MNEVRDVMRGPLTYNFLCSKNRENCLEEVVSAITVDHLVLTEANNIKKIAQSNSMAKKTTQIQVADGLQDGNKERE